MKGGEKGEQRMKNRLAIFMALTLVTIVFASMPMNVNAARVDSITPSKGKVGHTAVVHGEGFKGGAVTVKFGSADLVPASVPTDKVAKITIPNKAATDPDPVPVKLFVDDVLVPGDITFEYDPAGPEPMIIGYSPPSALIGEDFSIVVEGTDFMTPHGRVPDQIVLMGPDVIWGSVDFSTATDTSLAAGFPPAAIPGDYEILVGFSDGSGASAEGFIVN